MPAGMLFCRAFLLLLSVNDYADRVGRLSKTECIRTLATLDAIMRRKPTRTSADVDRELRALRTARRGGRRHGS